MAAPFYPNDAEFGGYEPVGTDVFLSMPTTLILGALIMLLAFLAGAFLFGRMRRDPADNAEAIWKAVRAKIDAALGVSRDQVVPKARALHKTLRDELGPILALADGVGGPFHRLDQALDGKGEDHPPTGPASGGDTRINRVSIRAGTVNLHTGSRHGDTARDDGHGDHGHDHADHGGGHGHSDHGHGHGHGQGHGRALSADEQIDVLRDAIHRLSDHWSHRDDRLRELRAIRDRLTRSGRPGGAPQLSRG